MTLLEDSDDEEMENTVHVSDSDSLSDELDQEEQRNTRAAGFASSNHRAASCELKTAS